MNRSCTALQFAETLQGLSYILLYVQFMPRITCNNTAFLLLKHLPSPAMCSNPITASGVIRTLDKNDKNTL